jgi:DNA primase
MSDTVQQIKDKLSIVDVVSQYVKLERAGASLRARCPFHAERTPSFFVSPDRGTYHCFGCNVGGDIFSFVEQIEGLDFKGALKILAERAGVPLVYERPEKRDARERLFALMETAAIFYASQLTDSVRKYVHERGIKDETIRAFRLGFAGEGWDDATKHLRSKGFTDGEILEAGMGKRTERATVNDKFRNRIMFPIADSAGRVVGFSGRIFGENASPEAPKYLNSPETPLFHKSRILYGFDRAKQSIRKHNFALLVEGQVDLLASHQAGWANTVAVSGTAFTPEHASLIRRMTDNLLIALDADEAGIKAAGRAARAALRGGLNVKVARLPSGLDPADLILKEGSEAWKKAIREAKDIITFLLDVLEEHTKQKDKFRRMVEAVVLPFLADVQSPIAREHYVQEIARRLGVSEHSVTESLARVPHVREPSLSVSDDHPPAAPDRAGRARQAFALLLWQESLQKPSLDLAEYEASLKEAMGEESFELLRTVPKREEESMRFSAESLYGSSGRLLREARSLLHAVTLDRLNAEHQRNTDDLRRAEEGHDEDKIDILTKSTQLLTKRIAELRKNM